jgi:hypothetical protein
VIETCRFLIIPGVIGARAAVVLVDILVVPGEEILYSRPSAFAIDEEDSLAVGTSRVDSIGWLDTDVNLVKIRVADVLSLDLDKSVTHLLKKANKEGFSQRNFGYGWKGYWMTLFML